MMSEPPGSAHRVVLISTTYYPSINDLRLTLALRTAQQARLHHIPFLIVDGSPDDVQSALRAEGAIILPENPTAMGGKGKGFAYRYGIRAALERAPALFDAEGNDFVIAISEPEKVDFVRFLPSISGAILPSTHSSTVPNIILPHRTEASFLTVPEEQRHSERFGNAHLHNVQRELTPALTSSPIDYLFGPVVFHASLSSWWLSNTSPVWDAQIAPYIAAAYAGKGRIASINVDYIHPREQTAEEEGKAVWSAKRFMQLQLVIPALEKAMREGAANAAQRTSA